MDARKRPESARQTQSRAIKELAEARKSGVSRVNQLNFDDDDDDRIYDVVSEEDYAKLVRKRQRDDDFVVDDDGFGYADDGEEHFGDEEDSGADEGSDADDDDGEGGASKRSRRAGGRRRRVQDDLAAAAASDGKQSGIRSLFGRMTASASGASAGGGSGAAAADAGSSSSSMLSSAAVSADVMGPVDLHDDLDQALATKRVSATAARVAGSSISAASRPLGFSSGSATGRGLEAALAALDDDEEADEDDDLDAVTGSAKRPAASSASKRRMVQSMAVEQKQMLQARRAANAAAASTRFAGGRQSGVAPGDDNDDEDTAAAAAEDDESMGAPGSAGKPFSSKAGGHHDEDAGTGPAMPSDSGALGSFQASKLPPSKLRELRMQQQAAAAARRAMVGTSGASDTAAAAGTVVRALPGALPTSASSGGWWTEAKESGAPTEEDATGSTGSGTAATGSLPTDLPTVRVPGADGAEEESFLHMYWLDAYEDPRNNPGTLFLFGKIRTESGQFASCCVTVNNLERCTFILPRAVDAVSGQSVSFKDVYDEVTVIMSAIIPPGRGRFAVKKVERNYGFEVGGVPRGKAEYLKLVYPAKFPPVPATLQGRTFSHVFGSSNPSLETFLLKRDIMGPCWLEIRAPKVPPAPVSWCRYEVVVGDPKSINPLTHASPSFRQAFAMPDGSPAASLPPSPPLSVLSISLKTVLNPRTHAHEIVAASCLLHPRFSIDGPTPLTGASIQHFTVIRAPPAVSGASTTPVLPVDLMDIARSQPGYSTEALKTQPNERSLLSYLITRIANFDPDVLLGHNISGFDLDILLHRMNAFRLATWSRIGRLRRTVMPRAQTGMQGRETFVGTVAAGRLICDTYRVAQELVRQTSYGLTALAKHLLSAVRADVDPVDVPRFFGAGRDTFWLVQHTENDAFLALRLAGYLQALPLTKQITNVAGNLWSRTLKGMRAERIEYLLLHEFHRLKYIVPDKFSPPLVDAHAMEHGEVVATDAAAADSKSSRRGGTTGRRKPAYAGGLVLEPKKGLYDKYILLLDFNSLYPSIIQEFNICFTTVERRFGVIAPPSGGVAALTKDSVAAAISAAQRRTFDKPSALGAGRRGADAEDEPRDDAAAEHGAAGDERHDAADEDDDGAAGAATGGHGDDDDPLSDLPPLPDSSLAPGVLPRVIAGLVEQRRAVKQLLKRETDPTMREQLNIKQLALKILANSMYGCLGFSNSRFFARPLAALVTSQGRQILQDTVDVVQQSLGLEVIYGDTDSVMVYTGSTDYDVVVGLAQRVLREVNKKYRKLELDIDGVFARMLLLKKKKYAALSIEAPAVGDKPAVLKREMKGLDMVRRDWCPLSKEVGECVLDLILSGKDREETVEGIHAELERIASDVRSNKVPLDKFIITKGLNKDPKDYPDKKGQAHLQVAMRMLAAGKHVNVGDHIPFVITDGADVAAATASAATSSPSSEGSTDTPSNGGDATPGVEARSHGAPPAPVAKLSVADRARHPDEVERLNLRVDIEWYLSEQVLPPVTRLCDPIQGTSGKRLAEALGLDPSKYASLIGASAASLFSNDRDDEYIPASVLDDEERFRHARPLEGACSRCSYRGVIDGAQRSDLRAVSANPAAACGLLCPQPGCGGLLLAFNPLAAPGIERRVPQLPHVAAGEPFTDTEAQACASSLVGAMLASARAAVAIHQEGWLHCDDTTCRLRTRNLSVAREGHACLRPGCRGRLWVESPHSLLHNQLEYFATRFDVDRVISRAEATVLSAGITPPTGSAALAALAEAKARLSAARLTPPQLVAALALVTREAKRLLGESAYHFVSPSVFSYVAKIRPAGSERSRMLAAAGGAHGGEDEDLTVVVEV